MTTPAPPEVEISYERPPVTEVVVAVKFARMPAPVAIGLGDWWKTSLIADLPVLQEKAPYETPEENFHRDPRPEFSFQFMETLPRPRLWFGSADEQELVQVQDNWLACNWRKTGPGDVYGRWPARRRNFSDRYASLVEWCRDQGFEVVPEQWEVSYINHIETDARLWNSHREAHKLFAFLPDPQLAGLIVEEVNWQSTFVFGAGQARLHAVVQPRRRADDNSPVYGFDLSCRGRLAEGDTSLETLLTAMDSGRDAIVSSFDRMTTQAAQELWGRK